MTTEKKLHRIEFHHESVEERVKHFHEFKTPLTAEEIHEQALRCLHCGTPYCSSSCPLHNRPVDGKIVIDDAVKARMEAYLEQYGARG